MTEPPPSVRSAMMVIWALVVFQTVGLVLRMLTPDQFGAQDGAAVPEVDQGVGIAGLVVGVVLIGLFVFFALAFNSGKRWARATLLVLSLLFLAVNLLGLFSLVTVSVTALALAMNLLLVVLLGALVHFLIKPDTAAWCQR